MLSLDAHGRVSLVTAQQALLSPLDTGDTREWQLRANRAVRSFLGADHSLFGIGTEAGITIRTDDTDPGFPDQLRSYYIGVEEGDFRFRDPCMETMGRARRMGGTGAYHQYMLASRAELLRSPAYHDLFGPAELNHLVGLSTPLPVGEVTQFLSFAGPAADDRIEPGFRRMELLVPAFEAGVRIHTQLIEHRAALASLLDRLRDALAVYSKDCSLLHCNTAFSELLSVETEAYVLRAAADGLALALAGRWKGRRGGDVVGRGDSCRLLKTRASEYRLLASYLPAELFGCEGVLVLVECLQPRLPPADSLRSRFSLTKREAEIALLLARGLTDGTIARRLCVSPHTARRHSENVLRKLGLHSRAAVALKLLSDGKDR